MVTRIYPALILVFVVASGTRLAFLYFAASGNLWVPSDYHGLANSLLSNWTYADKEMPDQFGFPSDLQRPLGYPFFLCLINPSSRVDMTWVAIVQSILCGMFAVFLAVMAARFVNATVGIMAGLFYAFDWVTIIHTPILLADTLYAIALTSAVAVFVLYLQNQKPAYSVLAGVLLGAAALIKPVAQLQLGAFVLAWGVQPKRRLNGLVFILAFALLVTPWVVRNYRRHQIYTLSAINTSSLYFYIAKAAEYDLQGKDLARKINVAEADWNARSSSPADKKKMMTDEAWKIIYQRWPTVIKQSVIGFARTCLGTGRETLFKLVGVEGRGISSFWHTVLPLIQIGLMWLLAVVGVGASWRAKLAPRPVVCLFVIVILLALLPSASAAGYCRFRVHAVPILCLLAAIGVWRTISDDEIRFFGRPVENCKTEK